MQSTMSKRKCLLRISTRYRRKLIREESDELFPLTFSEEECRANSHKVINDSASLSDNSGDEIVRAANVDNALFEITQNKTVLPFSDEINISKYNVSLSNAFSHEICIREDDNNSEK